MTPPTPADLGAGLTAGLGAGLADALAELPLKEMEGALLATALLRAVEPLDGAGAVRRAVELAGYLHRDATRARRGPLPRDSYITHPLRGALRLHRWGVDDVDVLVAAVLHDVVEDAAPGLLALAGLPVPDDAAAVATAAVRDVIAPAFGPRVARVVAAVSNPPGPRPSDPEERRRTYREHVLDAVRDDAAVLLVKTSDLYDNAGSLHHHVGDSPEQVRRLARKYVPLLGPVREELARQRPLPREALEPLLADLAAIEEGLVEILAAEGAGTPQVGDDARAQLPDPLPRHLPPEAPGAAQPDEAFDRYARLVTTALGVPVALVSLVTTDGQVFPGAFGLPEPWQGTRSTGLSHSFCQHVVARDSPLVVTDAREHPVLADNLAIDDLGVVAYAGFPLRGADGAPVGSLCAIDTEPREWTRRELDVLADLAVTASGELELRRAAQRADDAVRAELAASARTAEVTESMAVGYLSMDADWRITYANAQAVGALGLPREELVGAVIWDLFPATAGTDFEAGYRRAVETGRVVAFDAHYPAPLDAWYEVRATPEAGGLALYFIDITARRQAQDAVVRASAQVSALGRMALSLTDAESVEDLAVMMTEQGLAVLGADGGAVAVPDDDGGLASYISVGLGDEVRAQYSHLPLGVALPVGRAARTGERVLVPDRAAAEAYSPLLVDVNAATGCQAWASLPLVAQGRLLGVLTVGWREAQTFGAEQLELLETCAAQCAQALRRLGAHDAERAALAEVAGIAETLQRSMLTAPPEPDHLQIAVRYAAAAQAAEVGGDWYDAFVTDDGVTSLVIGDVTGHDMTAAAVMGQMRNLLRGIAFTLGEPPAAVLSALDRAATGLGVTTVSTALLAQVVQDEAHRAAGTRLLRWSNAGHLPPVVLEPDGSARLLEAPSDLLLGYDAHVVRHDHALVLQPGATVLLYTDGLVERRGTGLERSLAWLVETVSGLAGSSPEELCDALLALVGDHLDDDVALLALRAHPQDAPRPDR